MRRVLLCALALTLVGATCADDGDHKSSTVLAARPALPSAGSVDVTAARVLELVNAARGKARRCGAKQFDAVPPLKPSPALTEAATRQARDMASHHVVDHRGSDGSEPGERVSGAGYKWQAVGENIAAGQPSADAVVAAWLKSSEHCENIMQPQFTEMGLAFALAPSDSLAIYWALVFAAPE